LLYASDEDDEGANEEGMEEETDEEEGLGANVVEDGAEAAAAALLLPFVKFAAEFMMFEVEV